MLTRLASCYLQPYEISTKLPDYIDALTSFPRGRGKTDDGYKTISASQANWPVFISARMANAPTMARSQVISSAPMIDV